MRIRLEYIHLIEKVADHFGLTDEQFLADLKKLQKTTNGDSTNTGEFELLISKMYRLVNDPRFSFEVGTLLGLETHGYFGYAVKASKNLEQAILFEEKYMPVRSMSTRVKLNKIGDTKFSISLGFDAPDPVIPILTEMMVSCFVKVFTDLAGIESKERVNKRLKRLELKLSYPEPEYKDTYKEYFPFKISFNQPFSELIGPQDLLYRKNRNYDPSLHELMLRQVESELEENYSDSYSAKVKNYIKNDISKEITLGELSSKFNMSERTLKRKLNLEKTSFRKILLDTRLEESKTLMNKGKFNLEQISYLLGYKHASTFSNAFKSKYGMSPRDYIKSIR